MDKTCTRYGLAALFAILGCRSRSTVPEEPEASGPAPNTLTAARPESPPNALGLPAASVAAVVNPTNLPTYTGPSSRVEGIVLVQGADSPDVPNLDVRACPAALDTYGKLFRSGPPRADGLRPLADAIVVITGYSGYYLPAGEDAERVTIGASCGYSRRTIALTFGQRLEITNDSALPFAPYLEGMSQVPVMIAAPQQKAEPVKLFPSRADHFPLRDQLQKFVRGDVYVLRQPLHAVSDLRGTFRIDGVPIGQLRIGAHIPAFEGDTIKDINVQANATTHVELVLTYAPADAGNAPPHRAGP